MPAPTSGLLFGARIGVFWDLDDCPIPDHLTPASVSANIRSSLKNEGYFGTEIIVAYSLTKQTAVDFESAGVKLVQRGDGHSKTRAIFQDMLTWKRDHFYYSTHMMVISKDLSDNPHYFTSLLKFRDGGNCILLAQPEMKGNLCFLAGSVWLWSILSAGGSPVNIVSGCVEASPSSCALETPPIKKQSAGGSPVNIVSGCVEASPSSCALETPPIRKRKKRNKKRKSSTHSDD